MEYIDLAHEQDKITSKILTQALEDSECLQALTRSYCTLNELSACIESISPRRETKLFRHAIKEYQFALFAVNQGFYRHAFGSLRLSFELWLSAIEFSANEFSMRNWEKGKNDINWRRIINPETGVFSVNFLRTFCDNIDDRGPHYRALAESVYRECSEYVHGNASTHEELPSEFVFSKQAILDWCEKSSTIHMVALFSFFCRYLSDMPEQLKKSIEEPFMDSLSHIKEVRLTFGASA